MDLESAIEIAVAAHRGQSDKGGGPCEDPALVARVHAEAPREVLDALTQS